MHPILFTIGGLTFYTHGILAVLGIILGITFVYMILKRETTPDLILDNIIITSASGIIGARLAYIIVYYKQYSSIKEIFSFTEGGFISYGGMIVGALTLILLLRAQKENILRWFDVVAPCFFFGLAVGRIGEIFSGELNGVTTKSKFLQIYLDTGVVAVPFFEAILCLSLFVFGFYILAKKRFRDGFVLFVLLLLYSVIRFIIDFQRIESKILFNLSLGQIVSIVLFIFSAIVLLTAKRRETNGTRISS